MDLLTKLRNRIARRGGRHRGCPHPSAIVASPGHPIPAACARPIDNSRVNGQRMKATFALLGHLMVTVARLLGPGCVKTLVAQNLLLEQQLLLLQRRRKRAPNLCVCQRLLLGFWSLFLNPRRLLHNAIVIKPPTLLRCHAALKACKYRWLYSRSLQRKPGPQGRSARLIRAIH